MSIQLIHASLENQRYVRSVLINTQNNFVLLFGKIQYMCVISVSNLVLVVFVQMYVQDVLKEQLVEKALKVIHKSTGHLYVCGGMNMARDVAQTLQDILVNNTVMSEAEAGEYLDMLKVSLLLILTSLYDL